MCHKVVTQQFLGGKPQIAQCVGCIPLQSAPPESPLPLAHKPHVDPQKR